MKMKTAWLEEMNWIEAEQAIKDSGGIAIIPVGCLEQWGHQAVGCDTYQAMAHVKKVIELAQEDPEIKQLFVLPMIPIGYQPYMADFPGTVSVRLSTLREYYKDIAEHLMKFGVMKFIWCSGHSGNSYPIIDMGRELRAEYGVLTVLDRGWASGGEYYRAARLAAPPRRGGHGSGNTPWAEIPMETLERCIPQAKTWITKGKQIQGWQGVDDFTDPHFDDALGILAAKLKTSVTSEGDPMTVYMVGSYQEATPIGSAGDPVRLTSEAIEESHRMNEAAGRHTIAIIKAISKIKVPLTSKPNWDLGEPVK